MGTKAHITLRATPPETADKIVEDVQKCFRNIEDLLSAWDPQSELCQLTQAYPSNFVNHVSPIVRPCYDTALRLAQQSHNAFNPYIGATLRSLGVGNNGKYSDFDLGAIAKGFAVDLSAQQLTTTYTNLNLLLDLGGNLRVVGNGTWRTGIRNPFWKHTSTSNNSPYCAVITLTNGESIATSGNYERFIERDGTRYSHILDGRTFTHTKGIAGVTVITPANYGATLADGLSTTLFILGPQEGSIFLKQYYPQALALWIPDTPTTPIFYITPNLQPRLQSTQWPMEIRN